ncbi:MAG: fibronectin type III domain-containing protein [Thermoplasmata archaeon]|nr:fibronectin type III domain-containing protein [Thermoplasmata archaeon]
MNEAGEGEGSIVSTVPITVPSRVLNLRVLSKLPWVTLRWDKPLEDSGANITQYRIYRWVDCENETLLTEVSATETQYTDTSVDPRGTYHYRISAVNDAGEGERSTEVTVRVESAESIVNTWILAGVLLVVAGIVVVFLLIYFLFLRKKNSS